MRLQIASVLLFLGSAVIASEEPWPGKGESVYVAASFKKLSAASPVAGAQMQYDMPACSKVEIIKANPKKLHWTTKDPVGGTQQLEGAWLPRMHRTKEACEAQMSLEGEPSVVRSGAKFKLSSGEPKK